MFLRRPMGTAMAVFVAVEIVGCGSAPPPAPKPVVARTAPEQCRDSADCESHCREKRWIACDRLLEFASQVGGDALRQSKAELACQIGHAPACEVAAELLAARNDPKGAELAQRACSLDSPKGCFTLATFLHDGKLMAEDQSSAFELFKRACSAGSAESCSQVASAYAAGDIVEPDPELASQLYEKACNDGVPAACSNFGLALLSGAGVWPDQARGLKLLELSCEKEGGYCVALAQLYARGHVVEKDLGKARELYQRACTAAPELGCSHFWLFVLEHGSTNELSRAISELEPFCEKGQGVVCDGLGAAHRDGRGVTRDFDEAERYFKRACDIQNLCESLADLLKARAAASASPSPAELYRQACFEGGQFSACFKLGTPEATDRGLREAEPLCVAGDQSACELIRAERLK